MAWHGVHRTLARVPPSFLPPARRSSHNSGPSLGVPPVWCFRCEWLFMDERLSRSARSLNLFEEDLADFEPFTGPLSFVPAPQSRRLRDIG